MKNTYTQIAILCLCLIWAQQTTAQTNKYILDADTGNEMDDFYAIAYALADTSFNIIGLSSAQYNNTQIFVDRVWNGNKVNNFNSVSVSQAYNEEILKGMGKIHIPHPIGCNSILGYAWGYYPTATIPKSPAVEFIIAEAKKASPQNKLGVICIGASTNLAAAIETAPEIAANIHAYLLGCQYDSQKQVWNKNEFNIRNDLNAFDAVLNNLQLELTIMPISTARPYVFSKTETLKKLYAINHPTTKLLADMWVHINAAEERVMWDVALIIAIVKPELATLEDRNGPPENIKTSIHVYTSIDVAGMREDFWNQIQKRFKNRK